MVKNLRWNFLEHFTQLSPAHSASFFTRVFLYIDEDFL